MTSRQYKWLLFDADGTLFDYDEAEQQAFTKTIQEFGIPYEDRFLDAYHRINGAIWLARERGKITVERLKIKRFELLFEAEKLKGDPRRFSERYLENLAGEAALLDYAEETIFTLARHYNLALVTNGLKEVQRKRLKKSKLDRYFDEVIISDEIGASKPDNKFFETTFTKIGSPAKTEVLIIGDSLTSDIQGANNYGIDACWLNPERHMRMRGVTIKYEIESLLELVEILLTGGPR